LDEYEISPHPDLRKKALTYMLNINPSSSAKAADHHTQYLRLSPERMYVQEYRRGNPTVERCWVPWDWCVKEKEQREDNSIVIFAPSFDTLHAVKARYNHFEYQRTQVYGNLWHKEGLSFSPLRERLDWWDFDFLNKGKTQVSIVSRIRAKVSSIFRRGNSSHIDLTRRGNY
jgi:hypothetical protein